MLKKVFFCVVAGVFLSTFFISPACFSAEYKGPKKRIAVMDFEDKSIGSYTGLGSGMSEMLTTALHETGKFIVVERKAISDVLTEQDFGLTGRVRKETVSKVGDILGAQILIRGAVTEFEETKQSRGGAISFQGVSLGASGASAHVAVDIRMYDANTGVVLESHRSEGLAKRKGLNLGISTHGVAFGGSDFQKTPLGMATRQSIEDMVKFITEKMEERPWQGRVIKVSDNTVYINAGSEMGISVSDAFCVYNLGEELIDPETGLSLGAEKSKIGEIQVSSVEPKFSKAVIVSGSGFKSNDIVEKK